MLHELIFKILLISVPITALTVFQRNNSEAQLYQSLFENYVPQVRPVPSSETMVVDIQLYLQKLYGINVLNQSMKTTIFVGMSWTDHFLRWNPEDFNGTKQLLIPYEQNIWVPDLIILNALEDPYDLGLHGSYIDLNHQGNIITWSSVNLESQCKILTKKFPFDEQTCEVIVATRVNVIKEVLLRTRANQFLPIAGTMGHAEWQIISTSAFERKLYLSCDYHNCGEDKTNDDVVFSNLHFSITLKRTCNSCFLNIILPLLILAVMNLYTFFVPCESGEKTVFPVTVFLSLAVFLTIIQSALPESVDGIPYISMLVTYQLCIGCLTLLVTVVTLKLFHNKSEEIPKLAKMLVLLFKKQKLRKCTRSNKIHDNKEKNETCMENQNEMVAMETDDKIEEPGITWCEVSEAFDRLMFTLFALCEIITISVMLVLLSS